MACTPTIAAILSALLALPAAAQPPAAAAARAEVLVLGTYHMANPGRDVFNMQADDVLAPKRQAEIAELLETLLYMNADEKVAADVGFYYRQAHFGEVWNWAGADLIADWFRRNIRIYSNVVDLVDSPIERILVIIGAGHLGWLRQDFANDPEIRLRKLAEFAK